jgi:selT/selW/selH-like putative selenoprotein
LAAEIRHRFPDAAVKLIPSRGGRFEIVVDGAPVFEKSRMNRHPHPGEVVQLLEARQSRLT